MGVGRMGAAGGGSTRKRRSWGRGRAQGGPGASSGTRGPQARPTHRVRLGRATGGGMNGLQGPVPVQFLVHLVALHSWQFNLYLEQGWHFLPSKYCAKPPAADGRQAGRPQGDARDEHDEHLVLARAAQS